jgi:hypothetical protein
MLRKLIEFPTVSRDSNLELIHFARDRLRDLGAECRLTYDDERRKANLFATLGPPGQPGVALSGHTDVVPVDGQAWDTDPFELVEKDGKLYGRGTSDMKGFVAVALALAPEFAQRGLKTPLHFSFSYDEELGCLGVRRLIADLVQAGIKPASCIVGEPYADAAGDRAQRQERLPLRRARVCLPLGVCTPGRERGRGRRGGRFLSQSAWRAGIATTDPTIAASISRTPRCIPALSEAGPRSTSCPTSACSISRSAICRAMIPTRCWRSSGTTSRPRFSPK